MPNDPRYTAVNITKEAKTDLDRLQVVLSAVVGRRLSFSETVNRACVLLAPREADVTRVDPLLRRLPQDTDPCSGGRCADPARHAEGGHDV